MAENNCSFVKKIQCAQDAGYIGVIIIGNNEIQEKLINVFPPRIFEISAIIIGE